MSDTENATTTTGPTTPTNTTITTAPSNTTSNNGGFRSPPVLDDSMSYESWKKQVKLWQICCRLDKTQQAPSLVLSLKGKAREAGLELEVEQLNSDEGMKLLFAKLDGLYLKDENQQLYVCLKKFEQYKRPSTQSINDYINEFERLYNKLKFYKIDYPDAAVAYRLLESANLSKEKNELIRTTVSKLEYTLIKSQLRKLEDSAMRCEMNNFEPLDIKEEPLDTFYGHEQRGRTRGRGSGRRGGRNGRRGGGRYRGRGRGACFICHEYDHYASECPTKNTEGEKAEGEEEEVLLSESYHDDRINIYL